MTVTCSICGCRFIPRSIRTVAPDRHACPRPACRKALAKRNIDTQLPKHDYDDPAWVQAHNGIWNRIL